MFRDANGALRQRVSALGELSCAGRSYVGIALSVGAFANSYKKWLNRNVIRRPNILGVSCTAGAACRSQSGAAVAANDVRSPE